MRHALFLACALAALAPAAQAQDGFKKVGTTGFVILELPANPRSAALADVRVLDVGTGADALLGNPALVGFEQPATTFAQLSTTQWFADTQIQTAAAVHRFGRLGTVGLSVVRFDMGTMQGTANAGQGSTGNYVTTDAFSAASLSVGLSVARQLTDRFAFGATVRYVQEQIATYRAEAFALDLGMVYHTGFRSLRLGGVLQNFGPEARYIGNPFKLPTTLRFATAMEVLGEMGAPGRLTVMAEALHPNNQVEQVHTALEYAPVAALVVRGGYRLLHDEGGLSLGAGLALPSGRLALDVSYADYGRLGGTVGLAVRAAL